MNEPLVSIVMNCFNGETFLKRALESVIKQTYSNWELIFWDNLSTDKSKNIFLSINDNRLKYFSSEKFKILYVARNDALTKCNGKYITFLDTDDYWYAEKLMSQVQLLEKNENIGLVYTNYLIENTNKLFLKRKKINSEIFKSGIITKFIIKNYYIALLTVMIRKSFMKGNLQNFDSKYNMLSDFDYILRFSKVYEIDFIRDIMAVYNQHQNQLQIRNIYAQAKQYNEWFEDKIIKNKVFGEDHDFSYLKKRKVFLNFIKDAENKDFFTKIKDLFFYQNNLDKVKLFFLLFLPRKIFEKIFSLT